MYVSISSIHHRLILGLRNRRKIAEAILPAVFLLCPSATCIFSARNGVANMSRCKLANLCWQMFGSLESIFTVEAPVKRKDRKRKQRPERHGWCGDSVALKKRPLQLVGCYTCDPECCSRRGLVAVAMDLGFPWVRCNKGGTSHLRTTRVPRSMTVGRSELGCLKPALLDFRTSESSPVEFGGSFGPQPTVFRRLWHWQEKAGWRILWNRVHLH